MGKPVVAIVGRPNVGKSTLFNRLIGEKIAIVDEHPGITRDRLYRPLEWRGRQMVLVDTGGLEMETHDDLLRKTREQAEMAIEEADLLLMVVDGQVGLTPADQEVANLLRKTQKPVLLVVNKVDNPQDPLTTYEFHALGLGEPRPVSAIHGLGTGELLDAISERLPRTEEEEYEPTTIRVAVIGRPNVGKSSLVNAILGEERVIVSNVPGTTRDAVDTPFQRGEKKFVLIDTAGLRRKGETKLSVEKFSVIRALRAMERSDVCLLVLDATTGLTQQDKHVGGYAHEAGRGVILVVNKWDAVSRDDPQQQEWINLLRQEMAFLDYAPVIFVSALKRRNIDDLLDLVEIVAEKHAYRVPTGLLNDVLEDALARQEPPSFKGRKLKIYYVTQTGVKPPIFTFFVNDPELVHFSYRRYLENRFRNAFGFDGTPIIFNFREHN